MKKYYCGICNQLELEKVKIKYFCDFCEKEISYESSQSFNLNIDHENYDCRNEVCNSCIREITDAQDKIRLKKRSVSL